MYLRNSWYVVAWARGGMADWLGTSIQRPSRSNTMP